MVQPTSPASAARRTVSATASGASPKPFSRSAETGRSVASAIMREWASASSRVSPWSLLPMAAAAAALEVASASNPSPARTFAEPTSHGFGMTKHGARWSLLKRLAFSLCAAGIGFLPRPIQSNPPWSGRRHRFFQLGRATPVLRRKACSEGLSNLWCGFLSERQTGGDLQFATGSHGHGDGAKLRRVDEAAGGAEVDLVEGVESFAAELEIQALGEAEGTLKCHVHGL